MISINVYILCLTCLVNLSNQKSHNNYLSTLLPSVFYWDTINYVYVTPTKSSKDDQVSVDITLQIEGENIQGIKTLIFSETIRQKKIPKFHVFMNLEGNLNNSPFLIKVEVFAKFAHGMKVNGELTIKCLINNKEIIEKEIISETKKLISTQLIEGKWLGNIDIKDCGINEKQQKSNLKIIAEVVEKGSFLSNKIIKEWDPFTPGFEMIPLRPAYTRNTQNLHVYLFNSINEGNVELKIQCISDDRSVNGLNQSLIQRLGTIAEIKVDSRCISYIIKKYGLKIPKENLTVGYPINITLNAQPKSLATLHIYVFMDIDIPSNIYVNETISVKVLDRILKQIKVNKRVDIEEHFRQIVIYQRKGLPSRTVTLEQVLGENLNIESSTKEIITNNNNYLILHSTKDIISYSQQQPLLNNEEEEEQEEGSNDNSIIIDNNKKEKKQLITQNDKKSKWLFLQALIVQVVLDCSAYACAASLINEQSSLAKEAWMKLHNSFYKSIDLSVDYDVRIIAAFAYMSTPAIRSEMRAKLASRTINDNQVPYWGINDYSNKKSNKYDLIEKSLQKSSIVLVNSLALLAYTQNQSIYRFWRNEFNLEALSNWLIEQQNSNRQYENALDTFFASRALHQFSVVNAQRQIRQALTGTINANFTIYSSTSLHSNISKLFKDKDLPFGIFIRPNVRQMDLKSNGDAQLLLGVKVQIEKRKRSRRDPNDIEPIILNLKQKRIKPGFINQTVTIRCNSQLINSLQIEHGIFTGFNSYSHFVNILKGSAKFQIEPQISANAIYFVLINIKKEVDIIYSITLIEPNGGYLPENLAPISINAMYHHLPLAQLIVLPQDFDFIEQKIIRKERSVSEKIVVLPSSIFPVSTSFLIPLNNTLNEQILTTTITTQHQQFLNLITENNDKPQSDIVETICLQTGACTCAELSCTVKCSSCSRLTFSELCANINSAEGKKFALFFRISSNNIDKVFIGDSSTEYIVLRNVRIMEWKSNEIEHPEHINIWIRSCNLNCLRMINERREGELPRFLLIGDPRGLFDESDAVEIQNNNYGNIKINENSRSTKMLLQTHYLMRDDDRLLKSTDCYELFGKVEDESCV
ncbi:TED_complement domain-containing protein [Meloidogyne graminicola]|uniref:TED_complement domain-containing protein n=1 Tax=Meloidogyne graminicola TaxID=189291 RepID=A0A8S9ZQY9_9BILA|nr:TED_complement domain-containing protein [Meloidogyne graminicola]